MNITFDHVTTQEVSELGKGSQTINKLRQQRRIFTNFAGE